MYLCLFILDVNIAQSHCNTVFFSRTALIEGDQLFSSPPF